MMQETFITNMVRLGIVCAKDEKKQLVRVRFPDKKITSGWLHVLKNGLGADTPWLPSINDKVICLYMPMFNGEGFVLGVVQ